MADNVSSDSEKTPASKSETPDPVPETSSDDAASTQSSDVKTSDDVASVPSVATPVHQGGKGEDSSCSQSLLSTAPGSPVVIKGVQGAEPAEEDALIPRRRVKEPTPEVEGAHELQPTTAPTEHSPPTTEPTRRSSTAGFFSSLTQTFEISNEYVVNFFCGWQAYSIFISDSKYLVPVQLALVVVSLMAAWLGGSNLDKCPASSELPILMILVGGMGVGVMTFRILYVTFTRVEAYSRFVRKIIFLMNCIYFVTLCVEFWTFESISPSKDHQSESYCNLNFLYYVHIYNCVAFTVSLLSLLLHGPAYLFNSWKIGGPGFPDSTA